MVLTLLTLYYLSFISSVNEPVENFEIVSLAHVHGKRFSMPVYYLKYSTGSLQNQSRFGCTHVLLLHLQINKSLDLSNSKIKVRTYRYWNNKIYIIHQ